MTPKQKLRTELLALRELLKDQVAEMVFEHVRSHPQLSYGELARDLGMAHSTLILHLKRKGFSRAKGRASSAGKINDEETTI